MKLVLAILLSFFVAFFASSLLDLIGASFIRTYLDTPEHIDQVTNRLMTDFQDYIEKNNISSDDSEQINDWAGQYDNLLFYYVKEKDDSSLVNQNGESDENPRIANLPYALKPYQIQCADSTIICYPIYSEDYYSISSTVIFVIFFIIFFSLFLILIKRRLNCINKLAQDIKILESGNMNYPVYVHGNDELSMLAKSIDDMRLAIIERTKSESEAIAANRELITSLSHDLRTPLSKQIGYLDIIEYKKYEDEAHLQHYLQKIKEKAYQIKDMSDKLFKHFLTFDYEDEIPEIISGDEFLNQLFFEQSYLFESQGFIPKVAYIQEKFDMNVSANDICRVFDNLFSNIKKYAEPSDPIVFSHKIDNGKIEISIANSCREDSKKVESTNFGLNITRKLLSKNGGALRTKNEHDIFTAVVILPVIRKNLKNL